MRRKIFGFAPSNFKEDLSDLSDLMDEILPCESISNCGSSVGNENKRQKSIVWEHFTVCESDRKKVTCKHCPSHRNKYAYSNGGTTNLMNHLRSQHQAKLMPKPTAPTASVQAFFKQKEYVNENLEDALVKWVVKDDQSFVAIESEEFKDLLQLVKPGIRLPSSDTLKRRIMDKFETKKEELCIAMQTNRSKVSFSTDCWTSPHNIAFMGVTMHFIDENWTIQAKTLDFFSLPDSHTGENIFKAFVNVIQKFELEDKFLAITLDNASNNTVFMEKLAEDDSNDFSLFYHIRCFAHVLNLGAQAALSVISADLAQLRTGIKKIKSSPQALVKFEELQLQKGIKKPWKAKLDVKTRWNSTADMLEAALDLKEILISYFALYEPELALKQETWSKFTRILAFLKPFKIATDMTCAEKYPSLSYVVPWYNRLLDHLELWMREKTRPGETLHNSTVAAYAKIKDYYNFTSDCYTIATVLDPRFNISFYRNSQGKSQEAAAEIINLVENVYLENYRPDVESMPSEEVHVPGLSFLLGSVKKSQNADDSYCREFQMYIMEPVLLQEKSSSVLMWWKSSAHKYPNLSRMARDYLAIPGTSASSERLFSSGKELITDERNLLSPATIQACQCLKSWI